MLIHIDEYSICIEFSSEIAPIFINRRLFQCVIPIRYLLCKFTEFIFEHILYIFLKGVLTKQLMHGIIGAPL